MTIRIIDIETSGIDPSSEILEIASVDLAADGSVGNVMTTLVKPKSPIPPASSAVHHLIDADFAGAPELGDIIHQFRRGDKLHFVAHNCAFEQGFLNPLLLSDDGTPPSWVCTYKCALRAWPELDGHSNQFLRYHFGLVTPFNYGRHQIVAHRALGDAIVTAAIFLEIKKVMSWGDMVRFSREPALHTKFDFGKHFGERYDAHLDFCEWMLTKPDMDPSKRFSAEYWISQTKQKEAAA